LLPGSGAERWWASGATLSAHPALDFFGRAEDGYREARLYWQSDVFLAYQHQSDHGGNRILIVDDDPNILRLLRAILRTGGFEVLTAPDATEALAMAERDPPDLIILDLLMPVMSGREFYRELRVRGIQSPVMIASAFGARSAQLELGAEASIEKPFDPDYLLEMVSRLLPPQASA
jgi:CheY-like chemotaxis protein